MPIVLHADADLVSPYVLSVFVALQEKGLPFELRRIDLAKGEQRSTDFAAALTARVPMIEHQGFWLAESGAIVEYLEELAPNPALLPGEVRARARARQLMHWLRSDLMPLREARSTHTIFFPSQRTASPLPETALAAADKLVRVTRTMLAEAPSPSQLFATWSIVDAELALALMRLVANGDPVPAEVARYAEAQWNRPSVAAFVRQARPTGPHGS